MSANFPKIKIFKIKIEAQACEGNGVTTPPFWELEMLIEQGYGLEQALAVMARRRDDPFRSSCESLHKMASNQRAWRNRRAVSA